MERERESELSQSQLWAKKIHSGGKVHNKFAICIEKFSGFRDRDRDRDRVKCALTWYVYVYWGGHFKCWPCEQPLQGQRKRWGRGGGGSVWVWSCSKLSAGNLFVFCIKKFVQPKVETRVVHIVVSHCQRSWPPSLSPSLFLCRIVAFSLSFVPVWLHLFCTRCGKFVCYANWWQPKID